jgi:hypothetical protein
MSGYFQRSWSRESNPSFKRFSQKLAGDGSWELQIRSLCFQRGLNGSVIMAPGHGTVECPLSLHHTIIIPSSYHTSRTPRRHIGDTHHTSRRHSPHISATLSTHHDDTQTHHIDPQIDSTSLPSCHITLVHPIYSLFSLSTSHFSSRFAHQSDLYPHHPD